MQYIIILPGESNRLPSVAQLREAGFRVSAAVAARRQAEDAPAQTPPGMPEPSAPRSCPHSALALAAEQHAPYARQSTPPHAQDAKRAPRRDAGEPLG